MSSGRRAARAGVAATSGRTPSTMAQMALDAIDFIDALDIGEVDLLGFSIGSFLAQEIALIRPASVRKLVLASSAPKGASGMHGWAPAVIGAVGKPETSGEEYLLERVSAIHKPVFVANGDSDPMILPRYSYLLAGLIPGARLKIYPDSAHGFLFQHHAQFAADVDAFLASA
jgi:pimeloyl-ACP methyl ester carboxylesterase